MSHPIINGRLLVFAYCIILVISFVGGWLSFSGDWYMDANIVCLFPSCVDVSTRRAIVSLLLSSDISI